MGCSPAVHHRTGWRIAYVRISCIEISVVAAGWLLGGTVGVGTLIQFAMHHRGHLTEWSLRIFDKEGKVMRKRVAQGTRNQIPLEGAFPFFFFFISP